MPTEEQIKPIHFIVPGSLEYTTCCGRSAWLLNFKYTRKLNKTTCKTCIKSIEKSFNKIP